MSVLSLALPKPGLLVGEAGQALGVAPRGRGHGLHDAVDLLLGEAGERLLAPRGPRGQRARLLDREEVLVRDRRWAMAAG